jgi:hypothetical protein
MRKRIMDRLKDLTRKDCLKYLGLSALIFIIVYPMLASIFTPPTVPDFELQVNDWYYNPSIGSFQVSGTLGIQVPRGYYYRLTFVSIIDGNKTIVVRDIEDALGFILFGGTRVDPDWAFLLTQGITLDSKNVQLTFEYKIKHRSGENSIVLERGTEVFSVNVK